MNGRTPIPGPRHPQPINRPNIGALAQLWARQSGHEVVAIIDGRETKFGGSA